LKQDRKSRNREYIYLIVILVLAATFVIFSMSANLVEKLSDFLKIYSQNKLAELSFNAVFLVLLIALLIIYYRWRRAAEKKDELIRILDSVSPESEERLRSFMQSATDSFTLWDSNLVLLDMNDVTLKLYPKGTKREDLIGKNILEISPYLKETGIYDKFTKVLTTGKPYVGEDLIPYHGAKEVFSSIRAFKVGDGLGIITIDLTERKKAEEAQLNAFKKIRRNLEATVQALTASVEMRDPYTAGHQYRVSELAVAIAQEMNLSDDQIDCLRLAASIHDLGKISVPSEILSKPGDLNDMEFGLIKYHPQIGYEILKGIDFPWPIAEIVCQHHERIDGSGFPKGLKGDKIHLEARIIGVADVVEAMSSHRPYRAALGIDIALKEIEENLGILYDEEVGKACISVFSEGKFDFDKLNKIPTTIEKKRTSFE